MDRGLKKYNKKEVNTFALLPPFLSPSLPPCLPLQLLSSLCPPLSPSSNVPSSSTLFPPSTPPAPATPLHVDHISVRSSIYIALGIPGINNFPPSLHRINGSLSNFHFYYYYYYPCQGFIKIILYLHMGNIIALKLKMRFRDNADLLR